MTRPSGFPHRAALHSSESPVDVKEQNRCHVVFSVDHIVCLRLVEPLLRLFLFGNDEYVIGYKETVAAPSGLV